MPPRYSATVAGSERIVTHLQGSTRVNSPAAARVRFSGESASADTPPNRPARSD